jgi:alpha-ketoglutarate-dependent taurine dioxygenase
METEEGVYRLLRAVNNSGMCTIEDASAEPGTVEKLADRISPVSHAALYGRTFDVISQDNARNIAFTKERLRPHQDLVYYESPPGLQLLHCLKFDDSIEGGESSYLDGFEAAKVFRKRHPKAFAVLADTPATFQKIRRDAPLAAAADDGSADADNSEAAESSSSSSSTTQQQQQQPRYEHSNKGGYITNAAALSASYMTYQRPHIRLDAEGEITGVFWAPMFEGTLHVPLQDVQPYYEAYALFQSFLEEGDFAREYTVKARMLPGQCMVFNNRRILHGREGFSGSGERHLQGCYTNIDESLSRYIVLHDAHARRAAASVSGATLDEYRIYIHACTHMRASKCTCDS